MAERQLGMQRVAVAPAHAKSRNISFCFQLGHDTLRRSLGDANSLSKVA
jgi:hypothetical protein